MKLKIFIIVSFIIFINIGRLFSQDKPLPGETSNLKQNIQSALNQKIGNDYELGMILNIDSTLGDGLGPYWPEIGEVEDNYSTLTHAVIFIASLTTGTDYINKPNGVIGIYKNGQISWYIKMAVSKSNKIYANNIWCIKDINKDGKVEILTTWLSGIQSEQGETLWIVSWDGENGKIINDIDSDGESAILTSSFSPFSLADVEGDGIWEIQGETYPQDEKDSLKMTDESAYVLRSYSWNGQLYNLWPNTPQPTLSAILPRNKVDVIVKAQVTHINDKYLYQYSVCNSTSSYQKINEFSVDKFFDSVVYTCPKFWVGYNYFNISTFWNSGLEGLNYIKQGATNSDFNVEAPYLSLPSITNYYVRGWNGDFNDSMGDIFTNSKKGTTIGCKPIPSPFIPLNFIDTLLNYNQQSLNLSWIKNQTTSDKYNNYFNTAKTQLQQNNIAGARITLNNVLRAVDQDSTTNLISEAYALIRYNTEYLLANLPVPASGLPVKLVASNNTNLSTGSLQYYDGGWKDAVNNNDGTFFVNTTLKTVSLRMTYEYGTQTLSNVVAGSDTAIFRTVNTSVQLKDSRGSLIDTGTVQYYAGAWREFGTTTNGVTNKELLPNTYSFRMTYAYASTDKQQNIGTDPNIIFQTTNAAVQLKNSSGSLMDQGTVQYYAGAWRDFDTTTN
ncbi:MAG: hypothetical protein P4L45_10340, partial [Ignavibacteriaceae bacterium]|nr:hypothetical protein [Ignavibacteriaceae bacterium]